MMDISQPPRNSSPSTSPGRDEWRSDLALRLARREGRTVLVERRQRGPLAVQKALYQQGPEICHVVIIHPPGGIAGGDKLSIGIEVEKNGCALVTTPAATKWYKAAGRSSRQEIIIRLGESSALDWLPQENLFFNAVRAQSVFKLEVAPTASAIGWDMALLGRQAFGEKWNQGSIHSSTQVLRPDRTPLWIEQASLDEIDPLLESPQGMAGYKALRTLWAIGHGCTSSLSTELNSHLPFEPTLRAGATALPNGVLLLRCLAAEIDPLRQLTIDCWMRLRPLILGIASHRLRLWAT